MPSAQVPRGVFGAGFAVWVKIGRGVAGPESGGAGGCRGCGGEKGTASHVALLVQALDAVRNIGDFGQVRGIDHDVGNA